MDEWADVEDDYAEPMFQPVGEGVDIKATRLPQLNLDTETWQGWLNTWLLYAGENPWTFLYYILLGLSPFFMASMILSYKLSKALEAQEKEAKRKAKRESNVGKTRRPKAD